MPSSTSHRGSSDRRLRVLALAGLIGAPLAWLTALQAGYSLAYQACDTDTRHWVTVPAVAGLVVVTVTLMAASRAWRRSSEADEPRLLLARIGAGTAALMVIVMIASVVAPFVLRPCD
jgi:hypothetical protein